VSFSVEDSLRLLEAGSVAEAAAICEGLCADPEQGPDALHVLGVIAAHEGAPERAMTLLAEAVDRDPENVERRFNLGALALDLGSADIAVEHLSAVAAATPGEPGAHAQLGLALARAERFEDAVAAHEKAVALAPEDARLWSNLANAYLDWGKIEAAVAGHDHAARLDPSDADLHFNHGRALARADDLEAARVALRRALELDPEHARARTTLGVVLRAAGDAAAGRAEQERAFSASPLEPDVRWNLALARLHDGAWAEGWPLYEARRERLPRLAREGRGEAWGGAARPGETLVVESEQGLGDTLMFARFLAGARARVGRVVLHCQESLTPFLAESLDVEGVEVAPMPAEPCRGLYAPIMSLPFLLGAEVGVDRPYLRPSPARAAAWAERLGEKTRPRVGLVWQGNPRYRGDADRSAPLDAFRPLLELEGVEVLSLQQVHGLEQLDALPVRPRMLEGVDAEGAFLDTAAIMASLDLVVTTDTAPAHLAGAIGVPAALVLSARPDWRWGQGPEAWYPRMQAFRQPALGDWSGAVEAVLEHVRRRFALP
jgi:Flp pilus assembly protein TadD